MRTILILGASLLAACTSSSTPDPHKWGACGSSWNAPNYTECEAACANLITPAAYTGSGCAMASSPNEAGSGLACGMTIAVDGTRGCCHNHLDGSGNIDGKIFAECQ